MCRTKGAMDYQVRDADTLDGAPGDGPLDRGVLTRTGGRRGSDPAPPPRNSSRANPSTGRSPGKSRTSPSIPMTRRAEARLAAGARARCQCPRASPATAAVLDQLSAGFGLLGLLEYDPGEVDA
jgi:hypothetical protein